MKLIRLLASLMIFAVALTLASAQSAETPQEICDAATPGELTTMQFDTPEDVLEEGVDYRAIFCTDAGAVYIDLFESLAPVTVNNFVFLAEQGYYDGTSFHRVIEQFMAQGGDQTGTGTGGPGYQFQDEFVGFLVFDRPGLLAMANAGPGTNGSQFFITTVPTPHLNFAHTIFGDVLEGQENVEGIDIRDPQTASDAGTILNNVIIVTDPSTVESDYEVLPPATEEDIVATLEEFGASLPPGIAVDEETSGLMTTDEVVNSVPADFVEDFATFAETYGHQFRYSQRILNSECDEQQFFTFLSYTIDAFASAEDATGALNDPFIVELATANGLTQLMDNVYAADTETCSGGAGTLGMMVYTRGRYLVTVQALVPQEILQQVEMDVLLEEGIASVFEGQMSAIYLPEVRSE